MIFFKKRDIYFLHIRKTGGSTVNYSVFSVFGNADDVNKQLSSEHIYTSESGKTIIGWNVDKLNTKSYHYGFSHHPFSQIKVNRSTFTFSVFRDPFKRVVSHYKMLRFFQEQGIRHPIMKTEGEWIKNGAISFVDKIPPEHLCRQLFMFDTKFDVKSAVKKAKSFSKLLKIEQVNDFIESDLSALMKTSIHAEFRNESKYELTEQELKTLEPLKKVLEPEYDFLSQLGMI